MKISGLRSYIAAIPDEHWDLYLKLDGIITTAAPGARPSLNGMNL